MEELTIVIVSYQSCDFILQNIRLINHLNCSRSVKIVVVDNANESLGDKIEFPNTITINGATRRGDETASDHHYRGIETGLSYVDTRFLLVLDPDFYVIRKKWIQDILGFMKQRDLAILGAPWHPQHFVKWRYFPCSHCLFIDGKKIPISEVDLSPGFNQSCEFRGQPAPRKMATRAYEGILRRIFRKRAASIGHSCDTGYAFFRKYCRSTEYQIDLFQPVWRRIGMKRLCEFLLPDFLSYIPKRPNYFSDRGMEEFGLPNCEQHYWEEFLWKNKPWGFHIRCYPKKYLHDKNKKTEYFRTILKPFLNNIIEFHNKEFREPLG